MDREEILKETEEEEKPHYVPRPKWQIVGAWILLAIFLLGVFFWYYWIMYKY